MRAWSAADFIRLVLPRPSWVIPGVIPGGGWTLTVAPPKTGKSILMLQACRALSRGEKFLYWTPERPWKVAFVEADAPDTDFQVQVRAVDPEPLPTFDIIVPDTLALLDDNAEAKLVFDRIRDNGSEFVVFDALESLTRNDINTHQGAADAVRKLKTLAGSRPFVLIHHPRKRVQDQEGGALPSEDVRNASAGHHYLTANASMMHALWGNEVEGTLQLLGRLGRDAAWDLVRQPVTKEVAVWAVAGQKKMAPPSRAVPPPDGAKYHGLFDRPDLPQALPPG